MWGVPGTLLAARVAARRGRATTGGATQCARARTRFAPRATPTASGRRSSTGDGSRGLGPPHGLVGNVVALGRDRETPPTCSRARAVVEGGRANWPPIGRLGGADCACSGATAPRGSSSHAAEYLDEELLLARRAARLGRGAARRREGRRHLPRHRRQRLRAPEDVRAHGRRALARACARASPCMRSNRRSACRRRYSLFTGGVGAALFAADCIDARAVYPVLEDLI